MKINRGIGGGGGGVERERPKQGEKIRRRRRNKTEGNVKDADIGEQKLKTYDEENIKES